MIQLHPFHLVGLSPWPLFTSFSLLNLTIGGVLLINNLEFGSISILLGLTSTLITIYFWFKDVAYEGTLLGEHTQEVQNGLSLGFNLFIATEVIFFFSIFWAYFHSALSPNIEIGSQWPPVSITALDPFALPLLNTFLLLGSGAFVTYAHHAIIFKERTHVLIGLLFTLILSFLFTFCQLIEYSFSEFSFSDSVFGSTFFIATGFHGLHIIIGTIFLFVGLIRIFNYSLTNTHHQGFSQAILYWHFVDVVWLILFSLIYVWASI